MLILNGSPFFSSRTSWQMLDVDIGFAVRHGLHRRLQPLDVARVVGAEHVDHVLEAAQVLVAVIGDVGGEIGVAAVRLDQRPVDVVAIVGGAEQRLLAVFPLVGRLALGRLQPACVDHALLAQPVEGGVDLLALPVQRPLGKEHVVVDVEPRQVGLDQLEHRHQHPILDDRQDLGLGLAEQAVTKFGLASACADRHEIVAGIEARRDLDGLAQRLAVAQQR